MPTPFPRLRLFPAPFAAALALGSLGAVAALAGGCKGASVEGNRPVSMQIYDGQTGLPMAEHVVEQCVPESLILATTFSDDSIANFTNRAGTVWTSSNTAVVQVSTGIQTFGGANGGSYVTGSSGVLVPQANGTAIITASFQGLTATTTVRVVDAPSDLRLVRNDTNPQHLGPTLTVNDSQTLAPNTALGFDIYGTVRGVLQSLSGQAQWDLATADTTVATLTGISTGTQVVAGVASSGTPQTLQARPPACGITLATQIAVSTPTSVTLARELPGTLLFSTSPLLQPVERFLLTANFPNGATQDVAPYGTFTASDGTILVFGGQLTSTRNYGVGIATGISSASATFNPTTDTTNTTALLTSNSIDVPVAADTLTGIAISVPASKTLTLLAGATSNIKTTGTFASGATQDITRKTVFTTSDGNLLGVTSEEFDTVDTGTVTAGANTTGAAYGAGGTGTITASVTGLTPTDAVTVTVPAVVGP